MRKWFGLFALFLIQCSSQEETPPCTYTSTPLVTLKESELPALMQLPLDQQKLIALMWVPEEQCSCYLNKNGAVKAYKIEDSNFQGAPDTFPHLARPSASGLKEWQESQVDVGDHLLGLTVLGYRQQKQESIVYTRVYVRSDGPMWSLWHEYTHFLIGQWRASSPDVVIQRVRHEDLEATRQAALALDTNSEDYIQRWLSYFDLEIQFIQKNFGDEILIEALLLDYAHQAGGTLKISESETLNASYLINDFYTDFLRYKAVSVTRMQLLKNTSSEDLKTQIDKQIARIDEFETTLKKIYQHIDLPLPY